MKKKAYRGIAALVSVTLIASAVGYSLTHNKNTIVAEAASTPTLYGIESLIQDLKSNGGTYTILEVVPNADAAEIGYLVSGSEPCISTRDADTGEWVSWQKTLGTKEKSADR